MYAPREKVTKVDTTDRNIKIFLNFPAIIEKAIIARVISDQALLVNPKGLK